MNKYDATRRLDRILDSQGDGSGTIEQNVAGKTITGATNATPIVVTSTAHGYSNGDFVSISGVGGNTAANGVFKVANQTANTYELTDSAGADVAGNGTYTSGGTSYLCFACQPAAGVQFELRQLNVVAGDGAALAVEQYVGVSKLTNGVTLQVRNASGLVQTLTPAPVKAWADWGLSGNVSLPLANLTSNNTDAVAAWILENADGGLLLNGDIGHYLIAVIADDLSGLTYQRMAVHGIQQQ